MTPRGSRHSSGGRDGGRLLDLVAEGVDVVPQECPVGAHDQHVDDVEADLDLAVGRVAREPGSRRDLKVAALDLAALEAALAVLGCGDVDEDLVSSAIAMGGIDSRVGKVVLRACSSMPTRQCDQRRSQLLHRLAREC